MSHHRNHIGAIVFAGTTDAMLTETASFVKWSRFSSEMQNIQDVRVVVRYNHGTRFEEVTPCKSRYLKFLWNSPHPPFVEALLRMGRMK